MPEQQLPLGTHYAGFWIRTAAAVLDSLILTPVLIVLLLPLYYMGAAESKGALSTLSFGVQYLVPLAISVLCWLQWRATPGKRILGLEVVDADTFANLSVGQAIGRVLAYYVAALPLLLGFLWVGWDPQKRGWHDKLANTVVLRR